MASESHPNGPIFLSFLSWHRSMFVESLGRRSQWCNHECISSIIYIYIYIPPVIKHGNSTITCKWCTAKLIYKRWIVRCHVWLLKHRILKYRYMPSQKTTGTYRTYRFSRPPFRPVNQQRSRLQRRRRQGESGRSHGHRCGVGIF